MHIWQHKNLRYMYSEGKRRERGEGGSRREGGSNVLHVYIYIYTCTYIYMYNCVCYMYSLPPYSYIIHIYIYVCVQVHVVAFAVSACVTAHHRPAQKPFNPILGETYVCVDQERQGILVCCRAGEGVC